MQAFMGNESLESIVIPNTVTEIGSYAFSGCSGLTSITIPNSVTRIAAAAFNNCTSLTSVTIGKRVTSIGNGAFAYCTSLKEVYCKPTTPPTGGVGMFDNNPEGRTIYVSIKSVNSYKNVEGWKDYGGSIQGDFTSNIGIVYGTLEINYTSTDGEIVEPNGEVESNIYENGGGKIKFKNIDHYTITNNLFSNCSNLKTLEIPSTVTIIEDEAFKGCTNLTEISIGNNVESIGNNVFDGCTSLKNIIVPPHLYLSVAKQLRDSETKILCNYTEIYVTGEDCDEYLDNYGRFKVKGLLENDVKVKYNFPEN